MMDIKIMFQVWDFKKIIIGYILVLKYFIKKISLRMVLLKYGIYELRAINEIIIIKML